MGPTALHEMTITGFGEKRADLNLLRLITVFQKYFTPTRNIYHSRSEFFRPKQKLNQTAQELCKKLCELNKDCGFKNTTPAELMLSFIFTTDRKLPDKILDERESTVKPIMDRIKQDIHDKIHPEEFIPNNEIKQESTLQKSDSRMDEKYPDQIILLRRNIQLET